MIKIENAKELTFKDDDLSHFVSVSFEDLDSKKVLMLEGFKNKKSCLS
jgi:hypothetical protein